MLEQLWKVWKQLRMENLDKKVTIWNTQNFLRISYCNTWYILHRNLLIDVNIYIWNFRIQILLETVGKCAVSEFILYRVFLDLLRVFYFFSRLSTVSQWLAYFSGHSSHGNFLSEYRSRLIYSFSQPPQRHRNCCNSSLFHSSRYRLLSSVPCLNSVLR